MPLKRQNLGPRHILVGHNPNCLRVHPVLRIFDFCIVFYVSCFLSMHSFGGKDEKL